MVRIGIVVSVIWFVGFGAYTWFSNVQRLNELYSIDVQACSARFDRDQNSGIYAYCTDEATEVYLGRFSIYKGRIPQLLALDIGIVAFVWLVGLLAFAVTRLMRKWSSA